MENEYLTYKQTMKYLNIKTGVTLNKLISNGLPYVIFGKRKRFTKNEIDKFMLNHMVINSEAK